MRLGLDEGFRVHLEKATRADEQCDWTSHTVDYAVFKEILKKICRRRYDIRNMLSKSSDGKLAQEDVARALGTSVLIDFSDRDLGKAESNETGIASIENDYVNLLDMEGVTDMDSSDNKRGSEKRRRSRASVLRNLSLLERKELIAFLDAETQKAYMLYLAQWQRVSVMLEEQRPAHPAYEQIGSEILELIAFCVINVVTVCQILIRYDAYARTYEGTPMMDYWIKHNTRFATSFRKILQHEELQALADTFGETVQNEALEQLFESQRQMFSEIISSTQTAQITASSGHTFFRDTLIQTVRNWSLMGSFEDRLGLEPSYLMMRGQSLKAEMYKLVQWRENKYQAFSPPMENNKGLTDMQVYNLTLNLLSAFLYCMNYYIVEPSSTMYVNRLGAFDAMSGTLIGMVPLAAFSSSIPYSMWTNKSFRSPFIVSCCLLLIGNILYSLADQFTDIRIALLGRFITGLGAPKCIIRRYMADTTPMSLRTKVNALFGMVVAAGSAMGPAMAIVLNKFEYTFAAPFLGLVTLNGLTLPGYFMATLWLTFTFIVLLTFEEPNREGLEEQRQRESAARGADDIFSVNSTSAHREQDLHTIFSGESEETGAISFLRRGESPDFHMSASMDAPVSTLEMPNEDLPGWRAKIVKIYLRFKAFAELITTPVRICLGLLFAKVFTIEILVSATSALSKNRYRWQIQQVGSLGLVNGCLVIPFSIFIGKLSFSFQDRQLMRYLVAAGLFGMFLLIDLSDLVYAEKGRYNEGHVLAVGPRRYVSGYFISYLSIQAFEGVIGSTLSKVIPTSLASGTFNSGLLATLVDTFGRACGDNFISMVGFISIRQLMNMLFIPGFLIMLTCLIVIERCRDMLSV